MKFNTSKRPWSIMSVVGITIPLALAFIIITSPSAQGSYYKMATAMNKQMSASLPVRIQIPRINLNAALESVGLTPDGAVGVPNIPANAAWFNMGPRPGEKGSAVIVGHYGRLKNGDGSAFNNINKLKKGDKLYIKNAKGATTTFIVRESKTYDPGATAVDVFNAHDGKSHLNLITCEGAWNKVSKSYSRRLVVFTDRE